MYIENEILLLLVLLLWIEKGKGGRHNGARNSRRQARRVSNAFRLQKRVVQPHFASSPSSPYLYQFLFCRFNKIVASVPKSSNEGLRAAKKPNGHGLQANTTTRLFPFTPLLSIFGKAANCLHILDGSRKQLADHKYRLVERRLRS